MNKIQEKLYRLAWRHDCCPKLIFEVYHHLANTYQNTREGNTANYRSEKIATPRSLHIWLAMYLLLLEFEFLEGCVLQIKWSVPKSGFQVTVERPILKKLFWPITTAANSTKDQSIFLAITYNSKAQSPEKPAHITCRRLWFCFSLVEDSASLLRQSLQYV